VKICPYCNNPIPEKEQKCPFCGKVYWEPEHDKLKEKIETEESEEGRGCLSLFLVPLFLAVAVTSFLIAAGFAVNLVVHFENNQVKIIWIAASILAGFSLYLLLSKLRKKRQR
jgi:hypothetical protein